MYKLINDTEMYPANDLRVTLIKKSKDSEDFYESEIIDSGNSTTKEDNSFTKVIHGAEDADKTNRLLSVEKQLQMLRDVGFIEVDCL